MRRKSLAGTAYYMACLVLLSTGPAWYCLLQDLPGTADYRACLVPACHCLPAAYLAGLGPGRGLLAGWLLGRPGS